MFHFIGTAQSKKGDALPGWFVEARLNGSVVPIYADNGGALIQSVSGVNNRAKVDDDGNFDFWIDEGTYDLWYYNASGIRQARSDTEVDMGQLVADLLSTSGAGKVVGADGKTLAAVAGAPVRIRYTGLYPTAASTAAQETTNLLAAIAQVQASGACLVIDRSLTVTSLPLINGACNFDYEPGCVVTISGGSNGLRLRNTFTTVGSWTAAPTLTQYPASTGSYVTALTVDSATYAALAVGDHVYLSDNVNNTFSYTNGSGITTNYTNLAEIAMVSAKSGGTTVFLDRALGEWNLYSASGTVSKLGSASPNIRLNIIGEQDTARDLVRLEGFVRPVVDVVVGGNSSRGVLLLSCMGGRIRAFVDNLKDDEDNNSFGYGVCAAAATTDCEIAVNAKSVRHAYSDIIIGTATGTTQPVIFSGGVARRCAVTGVGVSCTAATWDTHTCSDRIRFENIKAYGTYNPGPGQPSSGLNCAMQVRGTNVTVDGLETNLRVGIQYGVVAPRNSILEINNMRHHNTQVGAADSTNSLISFSGFAFSGAGSHKVNIRNSMMHNLFYTGNNWNFVSIYNSEVNMGTSSSGFPGMDSQSGCLTEYVNCVVREPVSMNISGTSLTFDGGKIIRATAVGFNLQDGAVLKSRGHGIEITGGGSIANAAYAFTTISSGAVSFIYTGLWVDDARAERTVKAFLNSSTGGTVTLDDITAVRRDTGISTRGDADTSIRVGRDRQYQRFPTTLTADRTLTLETINAADGDWFEIFRPGAGAFNLLVKQGSTTLATLATNKSCRVVYDQSNGNWRVTNVGSLT